MTRDEAILRLMKMGLGEDWATGMIKTLEVLELLDFDEEKTQNKAIEAYEEAMKAQKAMDEV